MGTEQQDYLGDQFKGDALRTVGLLLGVFGCLTWKLNQDICQKIQIYDRL